MQQPGKIWLPEAGGRTAQRGGEERRGGMFPKDEGEQGTATERGEQPNATELEPSRDVSKQSPPDPSLNRNMSVGYNSPSPSWQKKVA